MGDPFSAIAGAASMVEVAIRSCNTLYDSICYIKDAPGLAQELQQSVQNVRSILQSLNALVAQYRQSQVFTAQQIPDAVSHEIVAIQTDLDLLSSLLPAPHSIREVRTGLKWIRDRRTVEKLVLKLQRHQISLTLALQSPLHQMAANSYENVLLLPKEIERRHLNTKDELKADLGTMESGLHDALRAFGQEVQEFSSEQGRLKRLLETQHLWHYKDQATIMNDIHAVRSALSDLSICDGHVRTNTTVNVPTEAAVARVIRAELRRVLKPTIEQCLDTFKASTDDQFRSMLKKIDEIAEHFGQELGETSHSCSSSASHLRSDAAIDQECIQDDTGAMGQLEPAQMGNEKSVGSERPDGLLVRRSKHWKRSKVFKWTIGTLWVTVTSTHTTSNVSYVGEIPQPQSTYRITIEFQPAQFLITFRGLTLSLAHIQDQRGHYKVCPLLATFATVPKDADVMVLAGRNDVAGLQSLFQRRLAAPSDRNERGETPLMMAVSRGAPDACRFLLAMGADPLVTNNIGFDLVTAANAGFFLCHLSNRTVPGAYKIYTSVLRPLQPWADDLVGDSAFHRLYMPSLFLQRNSEVNVNPDQIEIFQHYITFLKECGFHDIRTADEGTPFLRHLCYFIPTDDQKITPTEQVELALRIALELVAGIDAPSAAGKRPLSSLFVREGLQASRQSIIALGTLLLLYGADPCALDFQGLSIFDFADFVRSSPEFLEALNRSGFDIREVREETKRRQAIFLHGCGKSTAVDDEDRTAPSTEGLSHRRVAIRAGDED